MTDLLLYYGQWYVTVNHAVIHMCVTQRMNREHFEISAFCIFAINLLQTRFLHIFLKNLPDPQEMIKNEFETLIVENNKELNAEQIRFLRLLERFFAFNKHLTSKDFTNHPLADENPLDKFSPVQLKAIIKKNIIHYSLNYIRFSSIHDL